MAPVKKNLQPLGHHFLKEWREHAGLDQEEAAARLNVSRTLLSKIEGRKSPYSQRTLEAIADVYGCSPAQLLAQNPKQANSFVPYFELAEKTEGDHRKHVLGVIAAAVGKSAG